MPQKTSPFLEGKWGWNFGESGWNTGADENWLKFSYMFDANVDAIVSTLPPAVNGEAYFLTTDNRIYFVVDGTYYNTPVPKWFEFKIKSTGVIYRFNGTSVEVLPDIGGLGSRVDELEDDFATLGSAAFEDSSQFATASFQTSVQSSAGAGEVGFTGSSTFPNNTVGQVLQHNPLQSNITIRIPTDYPTLQAALDYCSTKRGAKGFSISVLIESGYVIPGGYRVDDVDLSHVIISSVDAEVTVSPSFTHIETYDLQAGVARGNFFSFVHVRSKAPRWNILVNHAAAETDGGYCLYWSEGVVYNLKGVKNADHPTEASGEGGAGFKVGGASHLIAPYAIATGCGIGFALTQSTVGDLQFADASNCRLTGIDVSRGSVVYALSSKVNNCQREGFYVRRSRVIAETAEIKNCPVGVRVQATTQFSALNAIFDGTPLAVVRGSEATVEITGATKDGSLLDTLTANLSPANVNTLDAAGYTSSNTQVPGNVPQMSAIFPAAGVTGGSISAPPNAYTVLHTLTGNPRQILGGTIYGHNIGMRITIDGVVALNLVVNQTGADSVGDSFTVLTIPPFACKNTFTVEVFNRDASVSKNVGWNIYRRV